MADDDWSAELRRIEQRGFRLAPGLTAAELERAESIHGFRFPPDLSSFLSCALPTGDGFPDWRTPKSPRIADQLVWPFDGIAFDIENNAFWWDAWGPRPPALADAIALARAAVARAPILIPVCGHRYMPTEPCLAGNPVFSAYQTDIIYYGADLPRYLACEFDGLPHGEAVHGDVRRIRFWTDLVDANG